MDTPNSFDTPWHHATGNLGTHKYWPKCWDICLGSTVVETKNNYVDSRSVFC